MYMATIIFFGSEGTRETIVVADTEDEIQRKLKRAKEIISKNKCSFLASVIEAVDGLDENSPEVIHFLTEKSGKVH